MDIQANKSYVFHTTGSFRLRRCADDYTDLQRHPRHRETGVGFFL